MSFSRAMLDNRLQSWTFAPQREGSRPSRPRFIGLNPYSRNGHRVELVFASPRKLPKPQHLKGRVVVLDLAFASEASGGGFEKITRPLIDGLGPRLAAWVDHHDHVKHAAYSSDPRFVLATKAEHGACPEMVTEEVVSRVGPVDTIVCHSDFDGLCSAAKWMRGGKEPYEGADVDARAIDTRTFTPSAIGMRFDRALRARPRDSALFGVVVRHLASGLSDPSLWEPIDRAATELLRAESVAREIARHYVVFPAGDSLALESRTKKPLTIAFADATRHHGTYDRTHLLLLGQERATIAMLIDADTLTLATPFDSGLNFLPLLGLSGGMPTLVSVSKSRLKEILENLGVAHHDVARVVDT